MAKRFRNRHPSLASVLRFTTVKKQIKNELAALKPLHAILVFLAALAVQVGCGSSDRPHEIARAIPAPVAFDPNEAPEQPVPEPAPQVEAVAEAEPPLPTIIARDWTDATGQFHTSAIFLSAIGDHVQIRKSNGVTIEVPLTKLSDVDKAYLRSIGISTEPTHTILGRVVGISDGDTVTVLDENKQQTKIRLEGIDSPENRQAYGTQSRKFLGEKIFQKTVRIEWREKDKSGCTLGHVFLDDVWINKLMIDEGLAWHYKKYSHDARLADAEDHARLARIGLWSESNPIAPWDFRNQEQLAAAQKKAVPPVVVPVRPDPSVGWTPGSATSLDTVRLPPSGSSTGSVHVKGYTRKDGTYVHPHTRSAPRR